MILRHLRRVLGIERLQINMADLKKAVDDVTASESALELRVTAHEANLKKVSDDLQAQIDALQSGDTNTNEAANALISLRARVDAFDADAPTA